MLGLPQRPASANERALGQWYTERFTSLTGTTVPLSYTVAETLNLVPLLLVFKNGTYVDATSGSLAVPVWYRERTTGITGTSLSLGHTPDSGSELVFKNGALLDPGNASVYTISGNIITLGAAAVAGDVFVVHYRATSSAAAGYSVSGSTLTMGTALVGGDVVDVFYLYRN